MIAEKPSIANTFGAGEPPAAEDHCPRNTQVGYRKTVISEILPILRANGGPMTLTELSERSGYSVQKLKHMVTAATKYIVRKHLGERKNKATYYVHPDLL